MLDTKDKLPRFFLRVTDKKAFAAEDKNSLLTYEFEFPSAAMMNACANGLSEAGYELTMYSITKVIHPMNQQKLIQSVPGLPH